MAAETGFMIDGQLYEVPAWDSFTMDEAQVLFDYTGFTLEDVAADPDETDEAKEERAGRFKNPGLLRAFMHIAYQRGNPDMKPAKVKASIGAANMIDALESFAGAPEEENEESPPALTTEPAKPSQSEPVDRSTRSGSGSETSSDQQDGTPEPTGISESGTSSTSDRLSSVA